MEQGTSNVTKIKNNEIQVTLSNPWLPILFPQSPPNGFLGAKILNKPLVHTQIEDMQVGATTPLSNDFQDVNEPIVKKKKKEKEEPFLLMMHLCYGMTPWSWQSTRHEPTWNHMLHSNSSFYNENPNPNR